MWSFQLEPGIVTTRLSYPKHQLLSSNSDASEQLRALPPFFPISIENIRSAPQDALPLSAAEAAPKKKIVKWERGSPQLSHCSAAALRNVRWRKLTSWNFDFLGAHDGQSGTNSSLPAKAVL